MTSTLSAPRTIANNTKLKSFVFICLCGNYKYLKNTYEDARTAFRQEHPEAVLQSVDVN